MATYNSFHWTTWNKGNFFYVLFSDTRLDRIKVAVGSLSLLQKKWCQITARSKATQEPGKNRALYPPTFLQPPRPNQPPTPLCPNPPFRHADFSISFLLLILSFNKTTASCLLTNGGGRKTSFGKIIWNTVKMQMIILLCFFAHNIFFSPFPCNAQNVWKTPVISDEKRGHFEQKGKSHVGLIQPKKHEQLLFSENCLVLLPRSINKR